MPKQYMFLMVAIFAETVGTTALQSSQQFTRLVPSVIVVVGYAASFYFMALALKYIPLGIVYAIWSGLGIVAIAAMGYVLFQQKLDAAAVLGMSLILAGILVIHLFSNTTSHS